MKFLVAERLDGRGVDAAHALFFGQCDGEFSDDGFAGAGGGTDEHATAFFKRLTAFNLERVEFKT